MVTITVMKKHCAQISPIGGRDIPIHNLVRYLMVTI